MTCSNEQKPPFSRGEYRTFSAKAVHKSCDRSSCWKLELTFNRLKCKFGYFNIVQCISLKFDWILLLCRTQLVAGVLENGGGKPQTGKYRALLPQVRAQIFQFFFWSPPILSVLTRADIWSCRFLRHCQRHCWWLILVHPCHTPPLSRQHSEGLTMRRIQTRQLLCLNRSHRG